MRILIQDSNRLFGVGIKHFLLASFPESQVAHADCCAEARGLLEAEPHDLLLLDIGIEKDNAIRLLKRLRSDHPGLPMLVLSDYPTDYHGPRAIRAGACGFIGKRSDPEELLRAVRCVLTGRYYISPELTDRLARGLGVGTVDDARHEALSPREFQVFRQLALGESVSRIARALDLSIKTVDTHRRRICVKMGMDKREDLARYAFEWGLIPSRRIGEQDKATRDDG